MLVSTVEHLAAERYRAIELSAEAADALTGMIEDIFDRIDAESETQRRDLTRQKKRLETSNRGCCKPTPRRDQPARAQEGTALHRPDAR